MLSIRKLVLFVVMLSMMSLVVFANNETVDSILTLYGNYPTTTVILEESGYSVIDNSIDLVPNATKSVNCHGSADDLDGVTNIASVEAWLYAESSVKGTDNNESFHYTNTSCDYNFAGGVQAWNCSFNVYYFAENSTWTCGVNITDNDGFVNSSANDTAIIEDLVSLDVHNATVDFGNLIVGTDYASDTSVLVYNTGNVVLDLSLDAFNSSSVYADDNDESFNCSIGSIPVGNLRFSLSNGQSYASLSGNGNMTDIGSKGTFGLQLDHQYGIDGTGGTFLPTSDDTWWAIGIPTNIAGTCTGRIMYIAEAGN